MIMKRSRLACLLLTGICAASMLCPAAWAAAIHAVSPVVTKEGTNVKLQYTYPEQDAETPTKLGDEVRKQVKTTARRTSDSSVSISTPERTDAEDLLGIRFAFSEAFDALPKGNDENVVVSFKPSQKVTNTNYYQYRLDGGNTLCLLANTRWDEGYKATETTWTVPGAKTATTSYTAQTGEVYRICHVKDPSGAIVQQYAMFQNGSTIYTLTASGTSLPAEYLYGILDTMTFPA